MSNYQLYKGKHLKMDVLDQNYTLKEIDEKFLSFLLIFYFYSYLL